MKLAVGRFPLLVDANGNTGSPFITPLKAVEHNLAHINLHHFEQYDLWFPNWRILVLLAVAALLSWRSTNAPCMSGWRWSSTGRDLRRLAEHLVQPRRRPAVLHRGVPAGRDHPAGHAPASPATWLLPASSRYS